MYDVVVVGTSWGGLDAVQELLRRLPPVFPLPIVVVQHRGPEEDGVAELFQRATSLRVREPFDKEPLDRGNVYVAPAGYHLLFEGRAFALSTEKPVKHARPSIDVALAAAAGTFRSRTIAVLLTGASDDGAEGAAMVKGHGGRVAVQDPRTAASPVLPQATLSRCKPDCVLPLGELPGWLRRTVYGR